MKNNLIVGAVALMAAAGSSIADTQALSNFSAGSASTNGAWCLGWAFSTNTAITVTRLSAWDQNGDGFVSGSQDVAIWRSDGTMICSTTVSSSSALSSDNFRSEAVTPVSLLPGFTYVVASTTGSDNYGYLGTGSFASGISYLGDRWVASTNLAFPTSSSGSSVALAWLGGNFSFTTVPTPTASIAGFASLAGLGGVSFIKRRRTAKAE